MAGHELPTIVNTSRVSNTYTSGEGLNMGSATDRGESWRCLDVNAPSEKYDFAESVLAHKGDEMPKRRVVQVYIVDPDERVPVEHAMIYQGEPMFTDATDQELFFEINVKELLEEHNDLRTDIADREASLRAGREIYLDKVRIRDLKMTVVTLASF